MQGLGSTITPESQCDRGRVRFSKGTQTFKDSDVDSLASDTLSEEFPLLPHPQGTDFESSFKFTLDVDDEKQTSPISSNTSKVNIVKTSQGYAKSSILVRHAPKKYTPNSNKNKLYCYCQDEDIGWYLRCDFVYPGCLEYYHAKCVGLEKLKEKECADKYSNCKDGTSYACPNCCKLIDKI